MDEHLHNVPALKEVRRTLRERQIPAERMLWQRLRNRQLQGRKFKRQYSDGPYILDFYCAEEGLAIELDGKVHDDPFQREYDAERTLFLGQHGVRVVRFENNAVLRQLDVVLEAIVWHFESNV